jgi:hypothetical protein
VTLDVCTTARSSVHVDREAVFREWYGRLVVLFSGPPFLL